MPTAVLCRLQNILHTGSQCLLLIDSRFVLDLDGDSIWALIGAASYHDAPVLRDALCKHLSFETFIGATTTVSQSLCFPGLDQAIFQQYTLRSIIV